MTGMSRTIEAKMNSMTAVPESAASAENSGSVTVDVLDDGASTQFPDLGGSPQAEDGQRRAHTDLDDIDLSAPRGRDGDLLRIALADGHADQLCGQPLPVAGALIGQARL